MARFCTRCGRPLPEEDGKCPFCQPEASVGYIPREKRVPTPQYVPQNDSPSGFSLMIKRYFAFIKSFLQSPVDALRSVEEDREIAPAIVNAALLLILTFFTSLITALILRPRYADFAWGGWLLETIAQPTIGLGIGLGGMCLVRLVGKERVNFRAILSSVGAASVLSVAALAVTIPLHIFGSTFYNVIWMLPVCCAAVSLMLLALRGSRNKPNFWQILILCGIVLVGFLLLNAMQGFFLSCIYSY